MQKTINAHIHSYGQFRIYSDTYFFFSFNLSENWQMCRDCKIIPFFFSFLWWLYISMAPSMCFFCIILFFILYYKYAKKRQYRHSWNIPLYQWGSNIIALLLFLSLPWVCLALIKHSLIKSTKTRTKVGLKFELLTVLNPTPFQKWDLSGVLGKRGRNWMWKREGIDESWGKERTVW